MADTINTQNRPIVTLAEARVSGLTRYFTGDPCKHGHVAERDTAVSKCLECASLYNTKYRAEHYERVQKSRAAWRAANPEKMKKSSAAHYAANREKMQKIHALWRCNNKERIVSKGIIYRSNNREKLRAGQIAWVKSNMKRVAAKNAAWRKANLGKGIQYSAKWRAANPGASATIAAKWRSNNPLALRQQGAARRARERCAEGKHTVLEIKNLLSVQRYRCAYCHTSIRKRFHVDHVMPLARGGSNWISNIQLLCQPCNLRKSSKHPADFARKIGLLI